ncbi:MAG: DNA polymerase III subunit chi [Gammaproteobacteria bacterium]
MPEVAFHTGVSDKLGYACRLLRKAWRQRQRVAVTGAPAALARLDAQLWVFEPHEFIPHLRLSRGAEPAERLAQRTLIWLVDPGTPAPGCKVLVNLGPDWPDEAAAFERVVELVDASEGDRQAGRRRWNAYKTAGWSVVHHPQRDEG